MAYYFPHPSSISYSVLSSAHLLVCIRLIAQTPYSPSLIIELGLSWFKLKQMWYSKSCCCSLSCHIVQLARFHILQVLFMRYISAVVFFEEARQQPPDGSVNSPPLTTYTSNCLWPDQQLINDLLVTIKAFITEHKFFISGYAVLFIHCLK